MEKISAEQFKKFVKADPAWASHLQTEVEVSGYLDLGQSEITHLSKHLHFTFVSAEGKTAHFWACKDLKVASGHFAGFVSFSYSGIEMIKDLIVDTPDRDGNAVSFRGCNDLKVASGNYPGHGDFESTGIVKIQDLECTHADFSGCQNLKAATGTYSNFVTFERSGIERITKLKITSPDEAGSAVSFCNCRKLKVATGSFPGFVNFSWSGVEEIRNLQITKPDKNGMAADFSFCGKIKVATGIYPGSVGFDHSSVVEIKEFKVIAPDQDGMAADFSDCENLKIASGSYAGRVYFQRSPIEKIVDLEILSPSETKELEKKRTTGDKPFASIISCGNLKKSKVVPQHPSLILDLNKKGNYKGCWDRKTKRTDLRNLNHAQRLRKSLLNELHASGYTAVEYTYDGYSDSMEDSDLQLFKGKKKTKRRDIYGIDYERKGSGLSPFEDSLCGLFLTLLETKYPGWELGRGASGVVKWNLIDDSLTIKHVFGDRRKATYEGSL